MSVFDSFLEAQVMITRLSRQVLEVTDPDIKRAIEVDLALIKERQDALKTAIFEVKQRDEDRHNKGQA